MHDCAVEAPPLAGPRRSDGLELLGETQGSGYVESTFLVRREDDPLFVRTYNWLHSAQYQYSYAGQPYGLPGSYRLPFTTSWSVADHLRLKAGQAKALKILTESPWDGGIITEGVKPDTAKADQDGRAFATAAGYVAHVMCRQYCIDRNARR